MRNVSLAAIGLATALAAASCPPAFAQPPMQSHGAAQPPTETPASALARRMLAVAAESDAAFLVFIHEANPKSQRTDAQWLALRQQTKDLRFHAVELATATHAELSVFDPNSEAWLLLSLDVTVAPPHTITAFGMRAGHRPADVALLPPLAPTALAAATSEYVEAASAAGRFSGAVLIASDGKLLLANAYGLADRETKTPNSLETQFRFGSMGKMFTAVAIMQLVQAGKLDLTAPIDRYLNDYPNADIATKVTINNLLTHTGGTGDIFGPEFAAHRLELKDPKDYVALYGSRAPQFAPGARTQYSNYGFMLMGRIVEVVSGQSYDDYIASHIFAPACMNSTGNQPESVHLPRRAVGYMKRGGGFVSAAETHPWRGTPAGGGYSTVGDLAKFADALMNNRLLDVAHTQLLTTGGILGPDGQFVPYDFGPPVGDGRRAFGHNGGAPGMSGELRIFPAEPGHAAYTVVVLSNQDPPAASVIANFISNRLP